MALINPALERLRRNEICLSAGVRHAFGPDIARILAAAGFDVMMLDFEQTGIDYRDAGQTAVAGIEAGIAPLVRVADYSLASIGRALAVGGLGIVAPHVETGAEAAEIVRHCRFAPEGDRGVAAAFPHFALRPKPLADAVRELAEATMVVVQIESARGVANAAEIAATDGVDVLLVGCTDLSVEFGKPGRYDEPDMIEACGRVIDACRRHGKTPGAGGFGEIAQFQRMLDRGMRYFAAGTDQAFLIAGAAARAGALRALGPSRATEPQASAGVSGRG
jgi:4-hydroxy-2-oxoheptanedioate aldolase